MEVENRIHDPPEAPQTQATRCQVCGSVVLWAAQLAPPEPGYELDLSPPEAAMSDVATYSPVKRKVSMLHGPKRIYVFGHPDARLYVLGSEPEPPSDLALRFKELVDTTTPDERIRRFREAGRQGG